jgi:hypothetical protein
MPAAEPTASPRRPGACHKGLRWDRMFDQREPAAGLLGPGRRWRASGIRRSHPMGERARPESLRDADGERKGTELSETQSNREQGNPCEYA